MGEKGGVYLSICPSRGDGGGGTNLGCRFRLSSQSGTSALPRTVAHSGILVKPPWVVWGCVNHAGGGQSRSAISLKTQKDVKERYRSVNVKQAGPAWPRNHCGTIKNQFTPPPQTNPNLAGRGGKNRFPIEMCVERSMGGGGMKEGVRRGDTLFSHTGLMGT